MLAKRLDALGPSDSIAFIQRVAEAGPALVFDQPAWRAFQTATHKGTFDFGRRWLGLYGTSEERGLDDRAARLDGPAA